MLAVVRSMLCCLLAAAALAGPAHAAVRIIHGPTPIPSGDARLPGDLTIINEKLAFALAVQSPAPYGVPRGAIVDLAPVADGKIQRDKVVFADFIPNNWSAWPNTYQRVEVVKDTPGEAEVEAVRDWGAVTITTDLHARRRRRCDAHRRHHDQRRRSRRSPTCARASRCGPAPATCSPCRAWPASATARRPARSPTGSSPTTRTGWSPSTRRISSTSATARATCT